MNRKLLPFYLLFFSIIFSIFSESTFAQSPFNVPILDYPGNNSIVYEVPVNLNWYLTGSTAGLTFNIQISSLSDFSNAINIDTLTRTFYTFTPVTGVTYYWHVRSKNSNHIYSNWTSTWSFTGAGNLTLFSLTPAAGPHGNISPSTVTLIPYGGNQTYRIIPDSSYFVSNIYIDSVAVGPDTSYTFKNVTANHTITALFSNICSITSTAGPNGNISPLGTNIVALGANVQYTLTPNFGYHVDSVFVDGKFVDSTAAYSFHNIQQIHTIEVTFKINTYHISAAADAGGSITPSGRIPVLYGGSLTFNITPAEGYSIQDVFVHNLSVGKVPTYTFSYVSADDSIRAFFRQVRTFYVSNSGSDLPPIGSKDMPLRTYNRAMQMAQPGDSIILDNGSFNEPIFISSGIHVRGSGNTIIPWLSFPQGTSNSSVDNLSIYASSSFGNQGCITVGTGCSYISLSNINVVGCGNAGVEFQADSNITISNFNVTNNLDGINLYNCKNITFNNVSSNSNILFGIITNYCTNFNFTNVSANNNKLPSSSSQAGNGLLFLNSTVGTINNISANYNGQNGLWVSGTDNLSFNNGVFAFNQTGISLQTDNILNPLPTPPVPGAAVPFFPPLPGISNFSFTGTVVDSSNDLYGLYLDAGSLPANSIVAPVFNGNFIFKNSGHINDVVIKGLVLNPQFFGLIFQGNILSNFHPSVDVQSLAGAQPAGIKINNSVFAEQNAVIDLYNNGTNTATQNVDFRYNDFSAAPDLNVVQAFILDSTDFPNATPRPGHVDFSGSGFGNNPVISISSNFDLFKGATYFIDVNGYFPVTSPINFLQGRFSFDTSKIKLLGILSNGIINDAEWNLIIDTSKAGQVGFAGFGSFSIVNTGKLFSFEIQIKPTAGDSIAIISGVAPKFLLNDSSYTFLLNSGLLKYHNVIGSIQQTGDITLDGVVNMSDFFALLLYLTGRSTLPPQALSNADLNHDNIVDFTDLTLLYNFINGIIPSLNIVSSSGSIGIQNISYNQSASATVPIGISNANNLNSLVVTLNYDPAQISYKAFKKGSTVGSSLVQALETKPGEAKFFFNTANPVNGNIASGDLILNFVNNAIPDNAKVQTSYSINGQASKQGPTFTFTKNGAIITAVDESNKSLPKQFSLSQNYPNPFNPSTMINYQIPKASLVTLKIYNMLGQEIKTLVSELKQPGSYNIQWNGDNNSGQRVCSGAYIYRIVAGSFIKAAKMILLK